jgi:polysaccharide biosynthesis transport protein
MSGRRIGFLSALRRWWAVIALASGAGALLGYAYASTVAPTYEAQARVVVDARLGDLPSQQATAGLIPTYAELVRSRLLLEPAMTRLGLPLSVEELQRDVRGEAEKDTRLLAIRVRAGEPTEAVAIANAVAAELVRYVSRNQSPSSGAASSPTSEDPFRVVVGIVEPAEEAERIRPRTALTVGFGALAALFGALAACVLAEALGTRVRDEQDLALIVPEVLGSVNGGFLAGRVGGWFRASADLERYEILAAGVARADPGAAAGLLILGAQGGDGSSSVALNLAAMTARGGRRVVLLDLGGSREIPGLKRSRARSPGKRISPARVDGITLERFRVAPDSTFVIAVRPASDSRPLQREEAAGLMDLLLRDADSLIVHAPSPRRPPDALVWARVVGRTLLVARRDHTKRQSVTDSLRRLEDVGAHVVGAVLLEPRTVFEPGPWATSRRSAA